MNHVSHASYSENLCQDSLRPLGRSKRTITRRRSQGRGRTKSLFRECLVVPKIPVELEIAEALSLGHATSDSTHSEKKNSLIPLAGIFDLLPIFVTMIQLPSHPDHIIHASSVKLDLKLEWILNITETLIGYELQSLTFHPS